MRFWYRLLLSFGLGLVIALLDLYLKSSLPVGQTNTGVFLGIDINSQLILVLHLFLVIAGSIWVLSGRLSSDKLVVFVMLVASVSNLVERLIVGHVTDYLELAGVWFNLADLTVSIGIVILLFLSIKQEYADFHGSQHR